MIDADIKSRILKVLDYWYFLGIIEQNGFPKESMPESGAEKPNNKPKGGSLKFLLPGGRGQHVSPLEPDDDLKLETIQEERLESCSLELLELESRAVYIGKLPRKPLVWYLSGKSVEERIERETGSVALALIQENNIKGGDTPKYKVSLSPLAWAADVKQERGLSYENIALEELEQCENDLSKAFSKMVGDDGISMGDLRAFCKKHLGKYLDPLGLDDQKKRDVLRQCLFHIEVRDEPSDNPRPDTLSLNFYLDDIAAIRKAVEKSDPRQLDRGPLALLVRYIRAGMDGEAEKFDILDKSSGSSELLEFYRSVLSYDNLPLGRWPSRFSPALMQQCAVNLTVGRRREEPGFPLSAHPVSNIMSVNGPPGTGKTTLLKDIIAANVVERACMLSDYEDPDDAALFKKRSYEHADEHGGHYLAWYEDFYELVDEKHDGRVNDLGILVCSTNNTAVENISKELPSGGKLFEDMFDSSKVKESEALAKLEDELGHEISYFSSAAMGQFEKDEDADSLHIREGLFPDLLLSARLGRQSNVSAFRERTLRKVYNQFFPLPQDHMRKAEYHEKNVVEYGKARKTFRKRYVRVMGMIGERSTALSRLSRSEKEKARIAQEIEHLEVEAGQMEAEIDKAKKGRNLKIEETCSLISDHLGFSGVPANSLEDLQSLYYGSKCGKLWGRYQRLKAAVVQASSKLESVSVGLFQKRRAKIAERYLENAQLALFDFCLENDISEAVLEAYGECREALAESLNAIVKLDSTVRKAKENLEKSKEKTLDLRNKEAELDRAITDAGPNKGENERYVRVCPELIEDLITTDGSAENADAVLDRRKRAHLSNPDYDEELAHERGLLFLDALNLIEKFVLASKAMESNLRNLGAMWGMEAQHEKEGVYGRITFDSRDRELAMPALMQTLFILAPVVSSTFASVGRLLRDVRISKKGSAPFGLLVVDEAGQAVPEAALGALVRCRRALVVGDPCQIPPVVSSEHDAIRGSLSNSKVVGDKFINKQLSVQQLADSQNSLGSYLRWNSESESGLWVGCPLVVHRRCISPIFDILNEVFYNDAMFKETRTPSKEAEKRFYWSSSQWIDVSGKENGNGDHYVPAQGRRVMIIVAAAFEKTKGDIPSLYLISPFKTVADGLAAELKEFFKDNKGIEDKIEDFARDNIGTIHSFQGKEADEVVFVLGCDHKSKRSTEFVNENIVNVAVSRAKYRLYIVGSYHAWKENRNIVKIKKVLDTQWLEHFERWKKHGDASELEIARKMIPAGESFPTENVDDWEGDASVDMEPYLSNVSAYLKQEGEGTIFNMIDDSSAKQFGFASKDSIQEEFAKVENVGKGIAMGIFLYNVLGVGKANIEVDASPCAVGFGSAFEGYMGKAFWKSFSKLPKGDMLAGPKKKDSTWMPTLGNYEKYLNRKTTRDELSYLMSQAVHEPAHSPDAWGRWWDKFVKGVSTVKEIRNSGAHPGKVVSDEDVAKQIDLLFGDKLSRENKQKRGLFRHEEAAEILRRAVSDSALVREAGDMFEHATNGNEVDDSVSIDKEKKKNGRREAEESARKSILNAEEEMSLTKSIKRAEEREYWPSGLSKKASEINALIESLGLITPLGHGSWLPTKEGKLLGIGVSRGTDKDATWCVYTDSVFREIVRRLEEA